MIKMRTKRFWLISSIILMVAGLVLGVAGTAMGGKWNIRFNLSKFRIESGSQEFVKETKKIDDFKKLKIETSVTDIIVKKGEENSVTYYLPEDRVPDIKQKDGVLEIKETEDNDIYILNFGFVSEADAYITVTVADAETMRDIVITGSTADVNIEGLNAGGSINLSTGDVFLKNNTMTDVEINTSTGDIDLSGCTLDSLRTETSTGKVKISDTKIAGKYEAGSSTGDIDLKNTELKAMAAEGSTLDITLNRVELESLKVNTSTGEVKADLTGSEDEFSVKIYSNTGDIDINGREFEKKYESRDLTSKEINIETSTGDVTLNFNAD